MSRVILLKLIDRYGRRYPEEADVIASFEDFVRSHENCFERSLTVGHVTGSAWIVGQPHKH